MSSSRFIAGDWGTSNLRIYLCERINDAETKIIATRTGPGVSELERNFEPVFFQLVKDWLANDRTIPIILSGMAGSTIGWHEAPYISCPASVEQIAAGGISFLARDVEPYIVAGLRTENYLGAPDVLRGEELQLLGWMHLNSSTSDRSSKLVILPGTHNKWVVLRNSVVETFFTAITGELFALLSKHSVLVADGDHAKFEQSEFLRGVAASTAAGESQLLHNLFSVRSRRVLDELAAEHVLSYLSGLLIGADVVDALAILQKKGIATADAIIAGEPSLSRRYQLALDHLGIAAVLADTEQIAIAGYHAVYQQRFQSE